MNWAGSSVSAKRIDVGFADAPAVWRACIAVGIESEEKFSLTLEGVSGGMYGLTMSETVRS